MSSCSHLEIRAMPRIFWKSTRRGNFSWCSHMCRAEWVHPYLGISPIQSTYTWEQKSWPYFGVHILEWARLAFECSKLRCFEDPFNITSQTDSLASCNHPRRQVGTLPSPTGRHGGKDWENSSSPQSLGACHTWLGFLEPPCLASQRSITLTFNLTQQSLFLYKPLR